MDEQTNTPAAAPAQPACEGHFAPDDLTLNWLGTPSDDIACRAYPESAYSLSMYTEESGHETQEIGLTRDEYVALKQYLAQVRADRCEEFLASFRDAEAGRRAEGVRS